MWKIINSWYTQTGAGNKKPAFIECRFGADWEIWTLAPVSRPTPLAGEPLHHLGKSANRRARNSPIKNNGGEGGIRTHVTVKSNGFQDRLVMTASIPLHFYCRINQLLYYTTVRGSCQEKIKNNRDDKFSTFWCIIYNGICWEKILRWKWKIPVKFFVKNDFFERIYFTLLWN